MHVLDITLKWATIDTKKPQLLHNFSIERIYTTKPHGMKASKLKYVDPSTKKVTLTWIPSVQQSNDRYAVGFTAFDNTP